MQNEEECKQKVQWALEYEIELSNRMAQLDAVMYSSLVSGSHCTFRKSGVDPYHPGSKGPAAWDGWCLDTADGWRIIGKVNDVHYCAVKGIDLVNYFTQNCLEDMKASKEAQRRKAKQHGNQLHTPNPRNTHPDQQQSQRRRKGAKMRRKSPFLLLPSELRNKVYGYIISEPRILIHGNRPNKEFNVLKSAWNPANEPVYRPRYQLSHLLDNDDMEDGLQVSPALLLVCKAIKMEVELFMYSKLSFCFDSAKVLNKFMNRASKDGLKEIRKLELQHTGYGNPSVTSNSGLKEQHDYKWRKTCIRVANEMPALKSLTIDFTIRDWPVTLNSGDYWWKTLTSLAKKGPLDHVAVTLRHKDMPADRVNRASRRLEDSMMSEKGRHDRDEREANHAIAMYYEREAAAEAARLERLRTLPPVQAKKILRIVLNEKLLDNQHKSASEEPGDLLIFDD